MAFWDKITSKGNVDDQRGFRSSGGGIGLGLVAVIALITYFTGGDVSDVINTVQNISAPGESQKITTEFDGQDSYEQFASAALGSINDSWKQLLANEGQTYEQPKLVLFREGINTGCGYAPSAVGRGHQRDRPVARTRESGDDAPVR